MRSQAVTRRVVFLLTVISAIAVGSAPPRAAAAEKPSQESATPTKTMPKSMGELMKMTPQQCFQAMDTGHKGYVTKEDFMNFQQQLWRNMDKGNKGQVTPEEFMYRAGVAGG